MKGVAHIATRPGPISRGDLTLVADFTTLIFGAARDQLRGLGIEADRQVGNRIGLHNQGLRRGSCAIDDPAQNLASDRPAIGAFLRRKP